MKKLLCILALLLALVCVLAACDNEDEHTHDFGEWSVSKAASCTEKGEEKRVCSCGESETREIALSSHNWGEWITTTPATCGTKGIQMHVCECGASAASEIPATEEHVFGEWSVSKAATCVAKGEEKRVCICGKFETRELEVAHTFGSWITEVFPNCNTYGSKYRLCECGERETVQILPVHQAMWVVIQDATVDTDGLMLKCCTQCGEELETEVIPKRDYEKSSVDGTTIADAEALGLVVTEYMANTTSSMGNASADAFQYIEVYNRGTTDVNLYDLAVVRGNNKTSAGAWNKQRMFEAKLSINPGSIYTNTNATNQGNACVNPNSAVVRPGEFAIIWFWTDTTNSVSNTFGKSLGATQTDPSTGKTVFHHYFRQHYRTQNPAAADAITDDLLVVAVYAGSTTDATNKPTFSLNKSSSYMYALVKDEAGANNFDYKAEKAYESFYNKTDKTTTFGPYNDKIVCLWQWGTGTDLSIPTHTDPFEGLSSVYVPAHNVPDYYNATRKAIDEEYENKHNFLETGYVDGFKEVALVNFQEKPTIGSMEAWQWAYVDADNAPDAVKAAGENWAKLAIDAYNTANVEVGDTSVEDNPEIDKEQDKIDVDREQLGNKDQNVLEGDWEYYQEGDKYYMYPADGDKIADRIEINEDEYKTGLAQQDDEGLGIWLWVIIGGAAAVVLAGVAVVLIIVLKKKNKPVAADDVAAEGEVEIIDEQKTEE